MFLVSPHVKSIQCIYLFFSFLHLFWDFETQQEQEWNVPPYQNHPNAPRLDVPPSRRVPQIQHLFCCTRIPLKIQNIQTLERLHGNSYWSLFSKVRPGKSRMSASESSVNVCKHHCSHITDTSANNDFEVKSFSGINWQRQRPWCLHSSFIWFISSYSYLNFPCGWSEWPSRKSAPHASVPPTGLPSCPPQTLTEGPMPFADSGKKN